MINLSRSFDSCWLSILTLNRLKMSEWWDLKLLLNSDLKPVASERQTAPCVYRDELLASFITADCWLDKQSRCTAVNTLCVFAALCLFTCWETTKETDVLHLHHCSVHQSICQILRLVEQKWPVLTDSVCYKTQSESSLHHLSASEHGLKI